MPEDGRDALLTEIEENGLRLIAGSHTVCFGNFIVKRAIGSVPFEAQAFISLLTLRTGKRRIPHRIPSLHSFIGSTSRANAASIGRIRAGYVPAIVLSTGTGDEDSRLCRKCAQNCVETV